MLNSERGMHFYLERFDCGLKILSKWASKGEYKRIYSTPFSLHFLFTLFFPNNFGDWERGPITDDWKWRVGWIFYFYSLKFKLISGYHFEEGEKTRMSTNLNKPNVRLFFIFFFPCNCSVWPNWSFSNWPNGWWNCLASQHLT